MAHAKVKGALGLGAVKEDMEETETEDASVEAMQAYMAALKGDDAAAALEAYRALQIAEG